MGRKEWCKKRRSLLRFYFLTVHLLHARSKWSTQGTFHIARFACCINGDFSIPACCFDGGNYVQPNLLPTISNISSYYDCQKECQKVSNCLVFTMDTTVTPPICSPKGGGNVYPSTNPPNLFKSGKRVCEGQANMLFCFCFILSTAALSLAEAKLGKLKFVIPIS